MIQDIDQPVFEQTKRISKKFKWLLLIAIALIILVTLLLLLLTKSSFVEKEKGKSVVSTSGHSPTPTTSIAPAGPLRTKWRKIKEQFGSLDPQQGALQPPKLDFDLGI